MDQISSNKGYFLPVFPQPPSYQFVDDAGPIVESNK